MAQPLTILFMPESAYGPTNNCIGIGDVLRRRGHRVVFAAEAVVERPARAARVRRGPRRPAPRRRPPDAPEQDAGQFWKDFIRDTAPEFRKPTIEQLATFMQPTWQALIDGARYCEPQLREIIARQQPDVIVEDNVVAFPALVDRRRAVRPDRVVQPARDAGAGRSRRPYSGLPLGRPIRVGSVPGGVRPDPSPDVGGLRRLGPRAGRAGPAGPRVHPHRRRR